MKNATTHTVRIRREILINVARLCYEDRLEAEIDRVPLKMFPKHGESRSCCIHQSRAIARQRLIAALGFRVEDDDELTALNAYAARALARTDAPKSGEVLTVIDEACRGCEDTRYFITDGCRGCAARACMEACPKDAIVFSEGRARIDKSKCINCGLCQKACPFQAVIYSPVPCEAACPVKAVNKGPDGRADINPETCISCGKCKMKCPFGAVVELPHVVDVIMRIKRGARVIAMPAPSVIGQFPGTYEQLRDAFLRLGFADVAPVAGGAEDTAKNEAAEFIGRVGEKGEAFMTTSCCPAYVEYTQKHLPAILPFVSHTKTPMQFTAQEVKAREPEAVTVFIGPCAAKRKEAQRDANTDYVLTFEELGAMLVARGVDIFDCADSEPRPDAKAGPGGWGFPVTGGVLAAVGAYLPEGAKIKTSVVDGINKTSIATLKVCAARKKAEGDANMLEVMCCEGGCVNGPGVVCPGQLTMKSLKEFIGKLPQRPSAASEPESA